MFDSVQREKKTFSKAKLRTMPFFSISQNSISHQTSFTMFNKSLPQAMMGGWVATEQQLCLPHGQVCVSCSMLVYTQEQAAVFAPGNMVYHKAVIILNNVPFHP